MTGTALVVFEPSKGFSQELADRFCDLIANGAKFREAAQQVGHDKTAIWRWIHRHESFARQYARAMQLRSYPMFEEMYEVADDVTGDTARDRLRVDTMKWGISKTLPKVFGDKATGDDEQGQAPAPAAPRDLARRAAFLLAKTRRAATA
jgi:hypothetical protein